MKNSMKALFAAGGALAAAGIINGTGSMALNRDPNRKEFRNWINKIVPPRAARA